MILASFVNAKYETMKCSMHERDEKHVHRSVRKPEWKKRRVHYRQTYV